MVDEVEMLLNAVLKPMHGWYVCSVAQAPRVQVGWNVINHHDRKDLVNMQMLVKDRALYDC